MLDVGADRVVLNRADGPRLTNIDEQQHAADFRELVFKQRTKLRHRQRRAGQVFRVGIVSKNERILAAGDLDCTVSRNQDDDGIILARAALEKILKPVANRRGGGVLILQEQNLIRRQAAAERTLQQLVKQICVFVGELERQIGLLVFRNADQ